MGGLADGWENRADSTDNPRMSLRVSEIHGSLNHIVRKAVTKHPLQFATLQHLVDHHAGGRLVRRAQALFNNVGAKLLPRQLRDIVLELPAEGFGKMRLAKVQNVLHNIVAKRILNKFERVGGNLGDETGSLVTGRVINASLQDTATMAMSPDGHTVPANRIVDELGVLRSEAVQALLDYVVSVQVLDQLDHMVLESADDRLSLLRSRNEFNHLLQSPSAVLVESNPHELRRSAGHERHALVIVGVFHQLLAEVVSERVCGG